MESKKGHFVLVHGAGPGAWCWYKVVTMLRSAGHSVTALDMAASGVHPKQMDELRSISDYFEPLMEFMASLPRDERVILVGHSMGGICISAAMEKFHRKACVAVFVTAPMPGPDLPFSCIIDELLRRHGYETPRPQLIHEDERNNLPTPAIPPPDDLASLCYQLSPPQDFTLATLLARPRPSFGGSKLDDETVVTKEHYGSVPRVYVVCDQDNFNSEDFQRWMIEKNPTDEVKVISGSDHMVMFSQPQQLCFCLEEIAQKYL